MPLSYDKRGYEDCFEALERGLESPRGVQIPYDSEGQARQERMRFYAAIEMDRTQMAKAYPDKEHPLHGRSEYSIFRIVIRQDNRLRWMVRLEKRSLNISMIEEIPEDEDERPDPEDLG